MHRYIYIYIHTLNFLKILLSIICICVEIARLNIVYCVSIRI